MLRRRAARWADLGAAPEKLHARRYCRVRCQERMGGAGGAGAGNRSAGRIGGGDRNASSTGAPKTACRQGPPWHGAGEPDSEESRALAATGDGRGRPAPGKRIRLAEHVHIYEEPCRIADSGFSGRESESSDRRGATVHCGIIDREAILWVE